ncbi:MAG: LamG domain-containing protein [Patescibacteria group bacterium]|nr:LamG domain-containing protein [Patescibacteria group bacterium]
MKRFLKTILFIIIAAGVAIGSVLTIRAVNNRGAAPVGWWKFDEGQGQYAYDAAGSNNATLGANATDTTPDPAWKNEESCKNGKCLSFDGADDYVSATDADSLEMGSNDFSISAWVKINAGGITNEKINTILAKRAQNQVTYSEEFNNAAWAAYCAAGTMTTNTTDFAAPDGTYTAEKIVTAYSAGCGTYISGRVQTLSTSASTQYTVSIWAKGAAGGESFRLGTQDTAGCNISLTTDWKRYTCTLTSPVSPNRGFQFFVNGSATYYVWGAQREMTDSSGIYTKTTSSAIDTGGYSLFLDNTTLKAAISSSTLGLTATYGSLTTGEWHYVATVYDRSGNLGIYVDGISKGSTSISSLDGVSITNTRNLLIGGTASEGINVLNGIIDDVRIYNYARSAAQIKADYNKSAGGKGAGVKVGSSQEEQNAADGLVGYWKMDEASWAGAAGEVIDSSGAGNHGVAAGGVTKANTTSTAKFGRAGDFDGTDDYVSVPASTIQPGNEITISFWAFVDAATQNNAIWFEDANGRIINIHLLYNNGNTYWDAGVDGAGYDRIFKANPSPAITNQWHYWAFTKNAATGDMKIYLDGVLWHSDTGKIKPFTVPSSSGLIGNIFNGKLDDVKIYNKARSAEQIRRDYETGPSPVAHWKMDEKADNTCSGGVNDVCDTSGNGNDGAISGAAWKSAASCHSGACLQFDGTDDYVSVNDSPALSSTNAMTISGWIKTSSNQLYKHVLVKGATLINNDYDFSLYFSGTYSVNVYMKDSVGTLDTVGYSFSFGDNKWHHYVAMFDGDWLYLYLDGTLVASKDTALTNIRDSANPFQIGVGGNGYYFNGSIDDVRIYNYARTQKQIIEDMNADHPAVGSPVGSYAGYWNFDEGQGDTAYDKSINKNNGDLAGACPGAATCPTWTTAGKFGKALSFDGGDYLTVADSAIFNTESFAVCAWVRPASFSNYQSILAKQRAGDTFEQFGLLVYSSGAVALQLGNGGTGALGSLTLNTWAHICGSTDGTTGTLYINGRALGTGTDNATYGAGKSFYIGYTQYGSGRYFNGLIDEVKFYPFDLSPAEIKEEFNRGSSLKLGASGTEADGITPSNSALSAYCVPGDATSCAAPIAHWKMDEKKDNTCSGGVNDVCNTSGNGNDGANTGGPVWKSAASCHSGSCLSFDGTDDYVNVADSDNLSFTTGYPTDTSATVCAWIKANSFSANSTIVSKVGSSYEWELYNVAGSGVGFWMLSSGGAPYIGRYAPFPSTNVWHYICGVYDGSKVVSGIKVYIDGIRSDTSNDTSGTYAGCSNTNVPVNIGRRNVPDSYFNGLIDDVRIYNYVRTPAQIAWDYNRGAPVGSWSMDSVGVSASPGTALNVYDSSGKANTGVSSGETMNNGTITGATWKDGSNCKYGSCLSFDGNDYVNVGSGASLHFAGSFTVEAWVNIPVAQTHAADNMIVGDYNGLWKGYKFSIASDSKVFFQVGRQSDTTMCGMYSSQTLSLNTWYHVVGVYDGVRPNIYVNGVKTEGNACSPIEAEVSSTIIGKAQWYSQYFNGSIDNVRIYNTALTATQVAALYNNNDRSAGASLEANLVGEWRLDENASLYAADTHYQRVGKYGYAMNFDGSNDYVAIPSYTVDADTGTIAAWFKTSADFSSNYNQLGFLLGNTAVNYSYLALQGNGSTAYSIRGETNTNGEFFAATSDIVPVGAWNQIITTFNNKTAKTYLNGILVDTETITNSLTLSRISGLTYLTNVTYFNGLIDDVRVYNYALTPLQVKTLYNENSAVRLGPTEGLP